MVDLTVIGDVNVDLLTQPIKTIPKPEKQKLVIIRLKVGGGAANFALEASRLGLKTRLLGVVGDDVYGKYIRELLVKEGIDCCLKTKKENTGITIGIQFENGKKSLLTYKGTNESFSKKDFSLGKINGAWLHIGGYNLLDSLRASVPEIIDHAKASGMLVSIDPDLKASVRFDKEKFFKILRRVDVLFLNEQEGKDLVGKNYLNFLKKKGAKLIVVKRGRKGCLAFGKEMVKIKGRKVNVKTPTGVGDVFDAAFVHHYFYGYDLKECLEFAQEKAVEYLKTF